MRDLKFRCYDKKLKKWVVEGFHIFGEVTLFNLIGQHCYETKGEDDSLSRYNDMEVTQWTGFQIKDKDLYAGDIIREETPTDGLDEVIYAVCTWIKEWGMWACLLVNGEYQEYLDKGAEALDETMFWTFPIEDSNKTKTICGNIFSNPELLNK